MGDLFITIAAAVVVAAVVSEVFVEWLRSHSDVLQLTGGAAKREIGLRPRWIARDLLQSGCAHNRVLFPQFFPS